MKARAGRKKVGGVQVMVRISHQDRALLDEIVEVEGGTISGLCRRFISEGVRKERLARSNAKAVELMEGFFGMLREDMERYGLKVDSLEQVLRLGDGLPSDPAKVVPVAVGAKPRSSNTGARGSKMSPSRGRGSGK